MVEIKDLLLNFKNILLSKELKKESIRKVISDTIGITINLDNIIIKNNVVYLNIKPIYKNEILIKKDQILSNLKDVLGKKIPSDFR